MSLVDIALGLHKQAEEKKKKNRHEGLTAGGAILASRGAQSRLMGYETVHHGTSKNENVASIKKNGLKKSLSGTGAGVGDVAAGQVKAEHLKGKVFTTTNKPYAKHYTKRDVFSSESPDRIITAHVPYRAKSRLSKDMIMDDVANGRGKLGEGAGKMQRLNAKMLQGQSRIYNHSIKSRFIEGGKGYAGKKQFLNAGHMRRYLSQTGGKARFATGVAQTVASAGLGALTLRNAAKSLKEKKDAK